MFLVPGTHIYRAFYEALDAHWPEAGAWILTAVTITFGVSFGLLFANIVVPAKKVL